MNINSLLTTIIGKVKLGCKASSLAASCIACVSFVAMNSFAEHQSDSVQTIDTARVFSSVPVYTTVKEVTPRQECWVETIAEERYRGRNSHNNNAPVIAGGVIGGVIGHSVGHGRSNKNLGAVVGSVLGAAVGHSLANQRYQEREHYTQVEYRDVQHCKVVDNVDTRRVFEGYDVTYEYLGNVYTSRMNREPGKELKIAVQITPIEP